MADEDDLPAHAWLIAEGEGGDPSWRPPPHTAPSLEFRSEPDAVAWLNEHLAPWLPWPFPAAGVVPRGYESYARVLHPALDVHGDVVPWSEVARWSGRALAPTSFFGDIATRADGNRWPGSAPSEESPKEICLPIAVAGADSTSTPGRCWFAVWEGYGLVREQARGRTNVRIGPTDGGGTYLLFHGPVADIEELRFDGHFQAPNWWWPDDRAWVVASHFDGWSTYVGGPGAFVERLLETEDLEVLPASPDDPWEGCHAGQENWLT